MSKKAKLVDAQSIRVGVKMDCPAKIDCFLCTLDEDHKGPHAAHGYSDTACAVWWDDGRGVEL